ncbi:hypothetical protein SDC9_37569 [bioreactor metagenome]|jgi:hypothetical protein|uniref:Uncharacterized protein n=1 Tax=bioreactor metagenome TaxID=1076179 RepID=A0A644VJH9_9ZZZZ
MKNNKFSIIMVIAIAILSINFFFACNESPVIEENNNEVILNNGRKGVSIFQLHKGDRTGKWPNQQCIGEKTLCGLWFQAQRPVDINTAHATFYAENNNLHLEIDYSNAENVSSWEEDVKNGYIEIKDDIILDNPEFLSQIESTTPIVLKPGRYIIFNVEGKQFSVIINY